ncbi:putative SGNH hydrolase-type esterase domain, SGNH hydrolase superfamily [Plasmopara halstedii]
MAIGDGMLSKLCSTHQSTIFSSMGLTMSSERRPVFYFIGDSITEHGSDPSRNGFITILQNHYVRSVDCVNRGLSGYNSKWVLEHGMPIFAGELQIEYSASFVTVFLGANDAVLEHGPDKAQYVSLQDYRSNLRKILHTVKPLLAPNGQVLLITPPCIIDSARRNDRSDASAGKYAKVCVDLAAAENVHVLDLHTYFNTTFPDESVRKTFFIDGLHFSEKGNKEVGKLLGVVINGMFGKEMLDKFNKWQLPDWHDFVPHDN